VSEFRTTIEAACAGAVVDEWERGGETTVEVRRERILEVCRYLKHGPHGFNLLADLTCADFPEMPERFRLSYGLFSISTGARLRLRVWAGPDAPEVDSVTGVWATADWHEREVYDMFGIRFRNHPDMTRILMPLDWEGHPLRRDYPIGGEEVQFSDAR
jgi:NADH-quinone oxidoreductase subunit C